MIIPTLRRILWYTPHRTSSISTDEDDRGAAIVANGHAEGAQHVPLLQDDDPVPQLGHYAVWIPYQRDQAGRQAAGA